jgi:hypothetical protein
MDRDIPIGRQPVGRDAMTLLRAFVRAKRCETDHHSCVVRYGPIIGMTGA